MLAVDAADYTAGWAQVNVPRTTWVLTDRQGTVRDLVAEQGGSLMHESVDYDPFGVPELPGGLTADVSALYAGREYDFYSDLYYNRARWYDAAMQRFISEDPMGFAGGDPNLYRYCNNSPINATDPSGQFWGVVTGGAVGALVGVTVELGISAWRGEVPTSGELLGAAVAGAVSGAIIGGVATADPTTLLLIGGLAGAAGGLTGSATQQLVDTGTIDTAQLGRDTAFGAVGGVLGAGVGIGLSRFAPAVAGALDDVFRGGASPPPALAMATAGMGSGTRAFAGAAGREAAGLVSQEIVAAGLRGGAMGGMVVFATQAGHNGGGAPKKAGGGETPAAARGRQAHKEYDYGPGFKKELTLPSGKRPDAVNPEAGRVIELKPNNAKAIRRGVRQVEGYRKELEEIYGKPFTGEVETYNP